MKCSAIADQILEGKTSFFGRCFGMDKVAKKVCSASFARISQRSLRLKSFDFSQSKAKKILTAKDAKKLRKERRVKVQNVGASAPLVRERHSPGSSGEERSGKERLSFSRRPSSP
jgi:hypothetical protein